MCNKTYPLLTPLMIVATCISTVACSDEGIPESPDRNELYNREFIKEFGVPDPNHDWTMATTAGLRVNAPSPVHLQVYAVIDGTTYIFADIPGFSGDHAVPVTIPKDVDELLVVADGIEHRCAPSEYLDLSSGSVGRGANLSMTDLNGFKFTLTNEDTGTMTLNFADNPDLLKVMTQPFDSEYLTIYSDNSIYLGGPFMPNASLHLVPRLCDDQDFDIYPIYSRCESNVNSLHGLYLIAGPTDKDDNVNNSSEGMRLTDGSYGIQSSTDGGVTWSDNSTPALNGSTSIRSERLHIDSDITRFGHDFGYSYALYTKTGWSYTFSRNNYSNWGASRFFDAKIKDMNTCYCSMMFFKEVPVRWSRKSDGKYTDTKVAVYGIYQAPASPASPRPSTPDVYIIEDHNYGYTTWVQPLYETKKAHYYTWRLFAEDLGGSYDWDFNDLVVEYSDVLTRYVPDLTEDFELKGIKPDGEGGYEDKNGNLFELPPSYSTLYPKFRDQSLEEGMMLRKVTVTPCAAGGTMPIYLAWKGTLLTDSPVDPEMMLSDYINGGAPVYVYEEGEYVIGGEMHRWLGGSSHHTPINVGAKVTHTGEPVTFYTSGSLSTDRWGVPVECNLTVLVDKDDTLKDQMEINGTGAITKIDISRWNGGYTVTRPSIDDETNIPQILVFLNNLKWPREGVSMGNAYPHGFEYYISAPQDVSPTWLFGEEKSLVVQPK